MQPLAMPCGAGAAPKPDWLGQAIQVRMDWLPADVLQLINTVSPLSTEQQIVGLLYADMLCTNQAQDPGPLALGDLLWDLAGAAVPNPNGSPGTLGWWIGQKLQYYAFWQLCQCNDTSQAPPAPVVPAPPSGAPSYPTDPELQPPLQRIEQNQASSSQALLTLYNGLQLATTSVRDLRYRAIASPVNSTGAGTWSMTGEGHRDLDPVWQPSANQQDPFGVLVELTAIPPSVKRRGTVNQRLYGVGSLEWDVHNAVDPRADWITQRDALHYAWQFVAAPPHVTAYRLRWRLQTGVVAQAWQLERNTLEEFYSPFNPLDIAYQPFSGLPMPPSWNDPPFYPTGTRQLAVPSGGGLPPAPFPCCA